jgi:DNA-directed RNA polymerase subunit RPC12/RpoP
MRIECSCGKFLMVDDKHSGKRVKCPTCGSVMLAKTRRPADVEVQSLPPPPKKRRAVADNDDEEEETPPSKNRRTADDVEEDEQDRPRDKKKKPKKAALPPWVFIAAGAAVLVLLLVVLGGAIGAYFAFFRKGPATTATGGSNPPETGPGTKSEPVAVKLRIPAKVGDMAEVTVASDVITKSEVKAFGVEKPELPADMSVKEKFQGASKVISVDAKGRPTRTEFTVTSFRTNKGKGDTELLAKNTLVLRDVLASGAITYRPKGGGVLSPEADTALGDYFGKDEDIDEDAYFGTTEKKSKGDSWSVNRSLVFKAFSKGEQFGAPLKEENVSGTGKFANIIKEGGATYFDFEIDVVVDVSSPAKNLGKGAVQSTNGSINLSLRFRVPADYSTGPVRIIQKYDLKLGSKVWGNGTELTIDVEGTGTKNHTIKYLPAGGKQKDPGKKPQASLAP